VTTGLRIAEVAARSGFNSATLRYYEELGLLPPPAQSDRGYRQYDELVLDRLAFIGRAKQLGCSLAEIADLTVAWDGGACGPVQDRLRTLVAEKQADAASRVAELVALSAELQRAAAALESHRPDGPCDDGCGCLAEPASNALLVSLTAKPDAPIACSLDPTAWPGRLDDWTDILAGVTGRSEIDDGVRLELDAGVPLEKLVALAAAEHDCCSFLSFAVTVDGRGIGLEVRSSGEAMPIVRALFGTAA
jgi:MerR family transcriptional regulator, copper efflux regulator